MEQETLCRLPYVQWHDKSQMVWGTHLNDLRFMIEHVSTAQVLAELKLLCLFHGKRVALVDSDINNSRVFQHLFMHNVAEIRTAFTNGSFVLAIRNTAPNLTTINKQQGGRRADPSIQRPAEAFAQEFDLHHLASNLTAVEWSMESASASFAGHVQMILEDPLLLTDDEKPLLMDAVRIAKERDPQGRLLFGNIFNHLVHEHGYPVTHRIIQSVRTAHLLNVCLAMGLPTALPHMDVPPDVVEFIVGRDRTIGTTELRPDTRLLPRKILSERTLRSLTFKQIRELQRIGDDVGYFKSLSKARAAIGTSDGCETYFKYLDSLGRYLTAMGNEREVELEDWQAAFVEMKRGQINVWRDREIAFWLCVPLGVYGSLNLLFGITVDLGALLPISSFGIALATLRAGRKRRDLSWLRGTVDVSKQ